MRLSPSIALLRAQSDARLTGLAREGNEAAFTALVERYRRLVLAACRRVLPEARAEDATQQVFIAAWKALGRGDDVQEVRPWLLRIARNTALNALRVSGYDYDELAGSLEGGEAPDAEIERRDVMRQTLAGLAALPDNQREALLRSAVQGAAHADIARDLGLTEGATRQLVLRARTTMRAAVSAVTPLPLVNLIAHTADRGGEAGVRLAEAAAGGSAAGATALLAKIGAVAVIAGGAAVTPAIVDGGREPARAASAAPGKRQPPGPATATPSAEASASAGPERSASPSPRRVRRRSRRSGRRGEPAQTPRPAAPSSRGDSNRGRGSSGRGGDEDQDEPAGSGKSGRGKSGGGSEEDHSGSSDEGEPTTAPTVEAPEEEGEGAEKKSGSGSGGRGRGKERSDSKQGSEEVDD